MESCARSEERLGRAYGGSARRIAAMAFAPYVLDSTGETGRDHAANLLARAWHAQKKFALRSVHDAEQESRWVHTALWNDTRSKQRKCAAYNRRGPHGDFGLGTLPTDTPDPGVALERKRAWERVCTQLDPRELDILDRLVDNAHNLTATLRSYGDPVSLKTFSRMVRDVIARASGLAQRDEDCGTISGLDSLYPGEESGMENPPCFGLVWEAFGTSECVRCAVRESCLSETASVAYPEARGRILAGGGDPTVQNLSREMEISEEAVVAVQAHASRMPVAPPPTTTFDGVKVGDVLQVVSTVEDPPPPPPSAIEEVLPVGLGPELTTPLSRVNPESAPKSRKKLVRPRGEPTPKMSKLDMRRKERRKKEEVKASAPIPSRAGAAKSVVVPAVLKAKRTKTLAAVAAAAANSPPSLKKKKREGKKAQREKYQWKNVTDRFARERERHPLIAALTPGTKLRRRSRKTRKVHELTVGHGYYEMKGVHYKTLQQATNAAAGMNFYPKQMKNGERPKGTRRMCDWGAVRFWKLKALFKIHAAPPKEPNPPK